jgi:hypothetical protein
MDTLKILILVLFVSCTLWEKERDIDPRTTIYRKDIKVTINEKKYLGYGVVPAANKYDIQVEAPGKLNFFRYFTCNRDEGGENEWVKWFKKHQGKFSFSPNELEESDCTLEMEAWEKAPGRHSWAYFDFNHGEALEAKVICDGDTYMSKGVTVCEAKKGTIQALEFKEYVLFEELEENTCELERRGNTFFITASSGKCYYVFTNKKIEVHRYTLLGYDEIALRK